MSLERHLTAHLQQMYVTQRDYQMYLCDWAGKVRDQQLKTAVNTEIQGINSELDNLKRCLSLLNAAPDEDLTSALVQALHDEDQTALHVMHDASPLDVDTHVAMVDISFGSSEIGSYQGVLTMARAMNRPEMVTILEDTLQHEEDDLQKMQSIFADLINLSQQQAA